MSVEFTANPDTDIRDHTTNFGYSVPISIAYNCRIDPARPDTVSRVFTLQNSDFTQGAISVYADSAGTYRIQGRSSGINSTPSTGTTAATTGFDRCVVVLHDGTTYSFFVNGAIVLDSQTWTNSVDFTGAADLDRLCIGGRAGAAQDWQGLIANFAIWNTDLTDDDALAVSNGVSPITIQPSDLAIWWEGTHDVYFDRMQEATMVNNAATSPTLNLSDNPQMIFPE